MAGYHSGDRSQVLLGSSSGTIKWGQSFYYIAVVREANCLALPEASSTEVASRPGSRP